MNTPPVTTPTPAVLARQAVHTQETAPVHTATQRNQQQIATHLRSMFLHCQMSPAELDQMVETRSSRLAEKGKSWEDVKAVLDKGASIDKTSSAWKGLLNSVPFGAAGATLAAYPNILKPGGHEVGALAQNFLIAALFVAYNSVGTGVMNRTTDDVLWLASQDKDLENSMKPHASSTEPSALQKGLAESRHIQTFTAKNGLASLVRWGADRLGSTFTSPENAAGIANQIKSGMTSAGSPVAGAATEMLRQRWERTHQRVGPEFLLGRTDWEERFDQLEKYGWVQRTMNVGSRALHFPLDIAQDLSKSIQSMFSPKGMVADITVLGGGIAAGEVARAAMKEYLQRNNYAEPQATLLADLAVVPVEAVYFGGWALMSKVTEPAIAFADDIVNKLRSRGALEANDLRPGQELLESGGAVRTGNQRSMLSHELARVDEESRGQRA